MKKKLATVLVILLLCSTLSPITFAVGVEEFYKADNSNSVHEIDDAEQKIEEDENDDIRYEACEFNDAYKEYDFIEQDLVSRYNENRMLASNISEGYLWKVPAGQSEKISIAKKDDNWETVGVTMNTVTPTPKETFALIDDIGSGEIDNLTNVTQVKFLTSHLYSTSFLYVVENDVEYFIPHGTRPDLTGLQNGKLYTVEQAMQCIEETHSSKNTGKSSASNTKKTPPSSVGSNIITVLLVAVIGVDLALIVFYRAQMRKQENL